MSAKPVRPASAKPVMRGELGSSGNMNSYGQAQTSYASSGPGGKKNSARPRDETELTHLNGNSESAVSARRWAVGGRVEHRAARGPLCMRELTR